MTDTRIKVGLSEETLAALDGIRGDVPRERWLRRVIEERVAMHRAPVLIDAVAVAEPKPSKAPPQKAVQVPVARATAEGERKVVDTLATVNVAQERCDHPKAKQRVINGGAVICDGCGSIRR
jgi:hypothetical protein